jgi:hypothetical protein
MFNTKKLTQVQFDFVQRIIKLYKGRTIVTRKEMEDAQKKLTGKVSTPYYVSKNAAAKVEANAKKGIKRGSYNLGIFKVGAERGDLRSTFYTAKVTRTKKAVAKSKPKAATKKPAKTTKVKRVQTRKGAPSIPDKVAA